MTEQPNDRLDPEIPNPDVPVLPEGDPDAVPDDLDVEPTGDPAVSAERDARSDRKV
jgi:hypothetical protein